MRLKLFSWKNIILVGGVILLIVLFRSDGLAKIKFGIERSLTSASLALSRLKPSLDNSRLELEQVILDQSKLLELERENLILRELLEFSEQQSSDHVAATVLGRGIINHPNILLIDKGEQHGLAVGFPVVTDRGILIGKILKVGQTVSQILLLVDSKSKITAILQNNDSTPGLISGARGVGIYMDLIPQDRTVEVGNLVVTAGLESAIPQGILIGQVQAVTSETEALFQRAAVTPIRPFNLITEVLILIPAVDENTLALNLSND